MTALGHQHPLYSWRPGPAEVDISDCEPNDFVTLSAIPALLPGCRAVTFAVDQNGGRFALAYNLFTSCITKIDLNQLDSRTDLRTNLKYKRYLWWRMRLAHTLRNSFILLALIQHQKGKQLRVVCFRVDLRAGTASVTDDTDTSIEAIQFYDPHVDYAGIADLLPSNRQDESSFYAIIARFNSDQKLTELDAIKVTVSRNGSVATSVVLENREFKGIIGRPFIIEDCVCFFSHERHELHMQSLRGRKIITTVPTSYMNCSLTLNFGRDVDNDYWSRSVVFNRVVYYSIYEAYSQMSTIWKFDMDSYRWEKTNLVMKQHALNDAVVLDISPDGLLFVHGKCAKLGCPDRSHFYQWDMQAPQIWEQRPRPIGRGGFGEVFEGRCASHGKFAVKILKRKIFDEHDSLEAGERSTRKLICEAFTETLRLRALRHGRIIQALGVTIEHDRIAIFLELMHQSVRQKIRVERRLSESEALVIIRQTSEGLEFLHTRTPTPIVHRDIKCANILLDESGNAKLGDFGIVRELNINTAGSTAEPLQDIAGTYFWMAPEVFQCGHGRKADIWSLGCSLVEMLTGRPPYSNLQPYQYVAQQGTLSFDPRDLIQPNICLSSDVAALLAKMFIKNTRGNGKRPVRISASETLKCILQIENRRRIDNLRHNRHQVNYFTSSPIFNADVSATNIFCNTNDIHIDTICSTPTSWSTTFSRRRRFNEL